MAHVVRSLLADRIVEFAVPHAVEEARPLVHVVDEHPARRVAATRISPVGASRASLRTKAISMDPAPSPERCQDCAATSMPSVSTVGFAVMADLSARRLPAPGVTGLTGAAPRRSTALATRRCPLPPCPRVVGSTPAGACSGWVIASLAGSRGWQ
jgi:hypothetical protein